MSGTAAFKTSTMRIAHGVSASKSAPWTPSVFRTEAVAPDALA
jgi:hypothetical protein